MVWRKNGFQDELAEVSTPSIDNIILVDRRVTVELISEKFQIDICTVHDIINNKFKYRKACARWNQRDSRGYKRTKN